MSRTAWVGLFVVLFAKTASAFDPFSIMAVVSTGVSIVSSISDGASELAGAADAMNELYSEADPEAEVSQGAKRLVQKMREVEALAQEAGETKEAIDGLLQHDREQAKSVTAVLRKLTQAVKTAKRLGRLLSKLEKKAQMAQLESVELERNQLKVQYKILEEQMASRLEAKKREIEAVLEKQQQVKTLTRELKARGAKSFGRSGVFSFPKGDAVLEKAIKLAKQIRPLLFGLVALAFFVRVVFYQMSFSGSARYGDLISDVIVCGLLLAAFPQIIDGCLAVSEQLAKAIAGARLDTIEDPTRFPSDWGMWIAWIMHWVRFVAFTVSEFIYSFGLAFLVILFPIVIFASTMLNFSLAWPVFLGSFLLLSLWPFFWNAIGLIASSKELIGTPNVTDQLKTVLFSLLQLVCPLVAISVLKGSSLKGSFSQAYASTFQPAYQRAQAAGRAALGVAGGGVQGRSPHVSTKAIPAISAAQTAVNASRSAATVSSASSATRRAVPAPTPAPPAKESAQISRSASSREFVDKAAGFSGSPADKLQTPKPKGRKP